MKILLVEDDPKSVAILRKGGDDRHAVVPGLGTRWGLTRPSLEGASIKPGTLWRRSGRRLPKSPAPENV
jgi:hypothetical protein